MESHKELKDFVLGLDYFLHDDFGPIYQVQVLADEWDILVEFAFIKFRRSNCIVAHIVGWR